VSGGRSTLSCMHAGDQMRPRGTPPASSLRRADTAISPSHAATAQIDPRRLTSATAATPIRLRRCAFIRSFRIASPSASAFLGGQRMPVRPCSNIFDGPPTAAVTMGSPIEHACEDHHTKGFVTNSAQPRRRPPKNGPHGRTRADAQWRREFSKLCS